MNHKEERERSYLAEMALQQHAAAIVEKKNGVDILLNYRDTSTILGVHTYAKLAVNRKDPKFTARRIGRTTEWSVNYDSQALQMLYLLTRDFDAARADYPGYRQSPYFEVFEGVAQRSCRFGSSLSDLLFDARTPGDEKSTKAKADALNFLGQCLSKKLKEVRHEYDNFSKNSKDQHKLLHARVYASMRKRSALTILRPDTSYQKGTRQTVQKHSENPRVISRDVLTSHRAEFGQYLNERFGDGMLDYFGVAEYGKERQWHIHWVIILDAAKHQSDILLAKELGEHWKTTITRGRGSYWNCNADKRLYKFLAIGKVHVNDETVRQGLRFIIAYFTLAGLFIKLDVDDGFRAFSGKIQKSKPEKNSTIGRPSACNDLPLYSGNEDLYKRAYWM